MSKNADYSRGYNAGRKKCESEQEEYRQYLQKHRDVEALSEFDKRERAYFKCLELALQNCNEWSIGGKQVKNAEGFCQLARIFMQNSIGKY